MAGGTFADVSHAEQALVSNVLRHGEAGVSDIFLQASPCGHCRQFLNELARCDALTVHLFECAAAGDVFDRAAASPMRSFALSQLLPAPFGPRDLGVRLALLAHTPHTFAATPRLRTVEMAGPAGIPAATLAAARDAATQAAAEAYCPYSHAPCGVGLVVRLLTACTTGPAAAPAPWAVVRGAYIENCAFNPSYPAFIAAVVAARALGATPADIAHVVVAACGTLVSHQATTHRLARLVCPAAGVEELTLELTGE
mmetsp:Transcript_39294/g.99031  ORF Transcript_39294/g.99031 Transcript_39294/m.99031 type:complete len:255 (-) Transcript_39294:73-837(-)